MKIRDFILSLVSWFILLVTVSCSDELGGERAPISSESNLHVLVPTVLSSRGTRADDASGLPTYNATVDECQINDLTLYAFPVPTGNGNDGKLLVETLPAPLATMMVEPHVANYQLNIEPGTYHIYVVANMNKVLSGQNIQTEDNLKKIVLNYVDGGEPGMPVSTNIPMIYEPKDVNGNIIDTKIEKSGKKYTEVAANLKFTCVKVKLNLIFDPTAEGSAFNGNSYIIKDILAQKLSPSTTLSWDGAFSKPASSVSQDYANGFENKVYATSPEASNKGGYYENWTEDAANANVNNKDIITLVPGATPIAAPQNTAAKWLFQGTYYLPERYIADASQQSTLKVTGSVNGNIENNYKIKLGHRQDESPVPTFPRGTYYEIIGKIKSLGNMTLDCNVSVKDWKTVTIDADFSHTTLWVNKTSAQITSIEEDSISYKSNWVNVEFGCDAIVDGKPLVVVDKRDEVNHIITFRINPEIPMSAYGNGEGKFPPKGKTKIWLKANNLKKYLDVDYNVEPLFEVDPLEVIIYYEASAKTNTKVFTWVTNLGGIVLPNEQTSTIGKSTISISKPSDENAPKGTFQVEATTDPGTTTVHTFRVHSKDSYNSNYKYRDIKVTVRPPVDNYRIYFRAINDRSSNSSNNDKFKTNQFQGILDEYYGTGDNNNNWNDSWSWDNKMQTSRHNVYIYSQKGETTGTAIPKENVWYFTNRYNNPSGMTGDTNNPGWYYKDMDFNAKGYRWDKGDGQETTTIKPGETLMIFYSFNNDGADLHRCPHHMAPGIPLFNYEDREGWILYDPTTDPYYRIFDEKPIVKDINYVVYTKKKVLGWAFKFGVATDSPTSSGDNKQYEHWDNTWDGHSANSFTSVQVGDWWKTTITLKAVDGYHEKGIVLQFEKDAYEEKYTLFGGRSYEKYNDTGYYDNNSWHPGIPSGV